MPDDPKPAPSLELWGAKMSAPKWAISALSVILIVGMGFTVYQKVYGQPEQVLLSLATVNKQLAAEVEEYSLHAMEEPQKHELFEETDGRLILRVFKDHCVLIQRQTARGVRTKLVMDLARAQIVQLQPSRFSFMPVVEAAQACNRGCLNPHPGNFRWWYGERRGSWVEVWRQWPEGCTHVQMFNVDSRQWDSNQDGSARVRWTCCVH